jgi:Ser/Thr protein kinase RdoA (MazF antagonist)
MAATHEKLVQHLWRSYGIQAQAIIRRRTVLGIVDEDGHAYIWKPARLGDDEARLAALAGLQSVYQASGTDVALPLRARSGRYLTRVSDADTAGYLQPWLTGRHVDVSVAKERLRVLSSLAAVQRASQQAGFPGQQVLTRGTLLGKLRMKEKALWRVWPTVEAAYPVLRHWRQPTERRMTYVLQSYKTYLARHHDDTADIAFCHRDLAPHNVLCQPEGRIGWIDFDHANYDDMLHDAIQFVGHTVFLAALSAEAYRELVETYVAAAEIDTERAQLLWTLTTWPDVLIRVCVEWVRQGCRKEGITRIDHAIACERKRMRLQTELDLKGCPF